jgi:hypothetical protein
MLYPKTDLFERSELSVLGYALNKIIEELGLLMYWNRSMSFSIKRKLPHHLLQGIGQVILPRILMPK